MTPDSLSAADFARLAEELNGSLDPHVTADSIVQRAVQYVPDAEQVSLTVRRGGRHVTLASTGEMALEADDLQYQLLEGPCVEAANRASWLRSGDVRYDTRWPRWGRQAADLGVASLISVQLLDRSGPVGAMNVYSRRRGMFASSDVIDKASIFAVHAATALRNASLVSDLHTAISSRHDIGMAQGILMERYGLDAQRSFELLRRFSATTNDKLRDVAASIARTGQIPPSMVRPGPEDPDEDPTGHPVEVAPVEP